MRTLRDLIQRLTQGKQAATVLVSDLADLRTEVRTREREIDNIRGAPIPRAELPSRIRETVRARAERWLRDYGSVLIRGEHGVATPGIQGHQVRLPTIDFGVGGAFGLLCAADPDQAERLLLALVARVPYEDGVATADRAALLDRLTGEIADLQRQEEAFVDALIEQGLKVEHRPEVLQRRAEERARRENEERETANRGQREAVVDERFAAAPASRKSRLISMDENRTSVVGRARFPEDPVKTEIRRIVDGTAGGR